MDISVAIGRNVDDKPMPLNEWKAYKVVVWAGVTFNGFDVKVEESGRSSYYDPTVGDFVKEDNYRIIASIDDNAAPAAYLALRDKLDRVRKAWGQWGIALSMVKTDMVSEAMPLPQQEEVKADIEDDLCTCDETDHPISGTIDFNCPIHGGGNE